ncbi:hypothetical protein HAX54_025327, partial [Datura stramonium]|nr:hypothetical protein [Datura stramonium]
MFSSCSCHFASLRRHSKVLKFFGRMVRQLLLKTSPSPKVWCTMSSSHIRLSEFLCSMLFLQSTGMLLDVGQKIKMFMQQSKHELCILSACGSISNASLRQPATSGGSITYE